MTRAATRFRWASPSTRWPTGAPAVRGREFPADRTSEFFGFFAVAERFATVLGPIVFTLSVAVTGSSRSAVLVVLLFFVAGAWLLSLVDEEAGIRAARER